MTVTTNSQEETAAIGRALASTLAAGSVVLLIGDLGAGKTALDLADHIGAALTDLTGRRRPDQNLES